MLDPAAYTPGKLLFKVNPKKNRRHKTKLVVKKDVSKKEETKTEITEKEEELTLKEREEQAISEMTEAEIKFQKNKIHFIKSSLDQTRGKTHRDLIEEQNEKLRNLPLHWDLEGK